MLKEKVILLLGATGGIGSEVARQAAEQGAKLILVARTREDLENLQQKVSNAIIFQADITKFENLERIVKEAEKTIGKIDVLIHTVGSILLKPPRPKGRGFPRVH
ncbi:MAG: putative enzyme [Promethearchaeota archaeon]|nr:MAG: putative enzyme [Candidatus Lokiarchaeota archaeon]